MATGYNSKQIDMKAELAEHSGIQRQRSGAFTLLELMLVVAIIAVLAGMALPHLRGISKSNSMQAATRQLLDDVALARQRALAHRTDVYMVFLSGTVLDDSDNRAAYGALSAQAANELGSLLHGELRGYALIELRSVGDQPGQSHPRYLTQWRKLPEGVYIPEYKFGTDRISVVENNVPERVVVIIPFSTNLFQFPYINSGVNFTPIYFTLPFIKFNSQGQCVSPETGNPGDVEYIPLTHGSVFYMTNTISVIETPPGNSITNYNLIHIDRMTGRAKLERKEIPQ